ncbi:MAG: ExeA family protein [Nitrospinota bacterium]
MVALRYLEYGIASGEFTLLTGEVGLGKTLLCRKLLKSIPSDIVTAYIINPPESFEALLSSIFYDLTGRQARCNSLGEWFNKINMLCLSIANKQQKVAVILDEAHLYDIKMLEGLRLLSNLETEKEKLIYLILVGQPELEKTLSQRELRPLAQRINVRYSLKPFSMKETKEYIKYRLDKKRLYGDARFTTVALNAIYYISGGAPRWINHLCDRALLSGYVNGINKIGLTAVRQAAKELQGKI